MTQLANTAPASPLSTALNLAAMSPDASAVMPAFLMSIAPMPFGLSVAGPVQAFVNFTAISWPFTSAVTTGASVTA